MRASGRHFRASGPEGVHRGARKMLPIAQVARRGGGGGASREGVCVRAIDVLSIWYLHICVKWCGAT